MAYLFFPREFPRWVFASASLLVTFTSVMSFAYAEIRCSELNSPFPGFRCSNEGVGRMTEISYRRIPAWGRNAGFVLVDICPLSDVSMYGNLSEDEPYVTRPLGYRDANPIFPKRDGCLRRLCSDDVSEFSIFLEVPFPITATLWGGVSIGYAKSEFQVLCSSTSENEEE